MPLRLNEPVAIRTGFLAEITKTGQELQILSLTFRLSERNVLVEYRIPANDQSGRDHRNAVVVPLESMERFPLKEVLEKIYGRLATLPNMGGQVDVSKEPVLEALKGAPKR